MTEPYHIDIIHKALINQGWSLGYHDSHPVAFRQDSKGSTVLFIKENGTISNPVEARSWVVTDGLWMHKDNYLADNHIVNKDIKRRDIFQADIVDCRTSSEEFWKKRFSAHVNSYCPCSQDDALKEADAAYAEYGGDELGDTPESIAESFVAQQCKRESA